MLRTDRDTAFNSVFVRDPSDHHRAKISAHTALWLAIAYLVAVPWYAPRDWIDPTLWALPAWAVVSIAGSVLLALATARALAAPWPGDESADADQVGPKGGGPAR
jgi:hypothetical protein